MQNSCKNCRYLSAGKKTNKRIHNFFEDEIRTITTWDCFKFFQYFSSEGKRPENYICNNWAGEVKEVGFRQIDDKGEETVEDVFFPGMNEKRGK